MPFYFFHIYGSEGAIPDEEGIELPDLEAAKRLGGGSAQEIATLLLDEVGR